MSDPVWFQNAAPMYHPSPSQVRHISPSRIPFSPSMSTPAPVTVGHRPIKVNTNPMRMAPSRDSMQPPSSPIKHISVNLLPRPSPSVGLAVPPPPATVTPLPDGFYHVNTDPRNARSRSRSTGASVKRVGRYVEPRTPYSETRGSVKVSVTPYTTLSLAQPVVPIVPLSHTLTQMAIYKGEFVKNPNAEKLHRSLTHKEATQENITPRRRSTTPTPYRNMTARDKHTFRDILQQKYVSATELPLPGLFVQHAMTGNLPDLSRV
eukprot:PhF_6_TR35719/c0_g1_i1/m.51860